MAYVDRFHLEHQTPPSWPSHAVSHDECERHLRKLTRTSCGCMKYGRATRRPKAAIRTASGLVIETNASRLFLTMSADRPLRGSDFACHACTDELCANPDHLYVGTSSSNVIDKFYPNRRIRPRRAARFFDYLLLEMPEASPLLTSPAPQEVKPVPDTPLMRSGAVLYGTQRRSAALILQGY